jgi:hypothetical protein
VQTKDNVQQLAAICKIRTPSFELLEPSQEAIVLISGWYSECSLYTTLAKNILNIQANAYTADPATNMAPN